MIRILAILCIFLGVEFATGEELLIDLRKGGNDPLIDFVPPPFGSIDRSRFQRDGLRIEQFADVKGKKTGITGLKSTVAASGDFSVTLDVKVNKLSGPSEGWGHGIIFAVFLDDASQTTLKLNQVSLTNEKAYQSLVEISGRYVQNPIYHNAPPLKDGKLIIQRKGNAAIFFVAYDNSSEPTEIARYDCPVADIRCIEVWSTRVDQGNAPVDVLVKQLKIEADGFYSFKKRPHFTWTWWQTLIAVNSLVLAVSGFLWWRTSHPAKSKSSR